MMGTFLLFTGDIAEGRGHLDQAIALYDPAEHRPLATRFGLDIAVHILVFRSLALWLLGYPEAALKDADDALRNAREIGQATWLMTALCVLAAPYTLCGNRAAAAAQAQELVALAEEKGSLFWKAFGMVNQGCVLALTGRTLDASKCWYFRDGRHADNGSDSLDAILFAALGPRPCGTGAIRGGLALHRRGDDSGGNNQGKVVRGRDPPNRRAKSR